MKNRKKYLNLATGMAFLAVNYGALIFTALGTYGLVMIRDFAIRDLDKNMKAKTEALIALNVLRAGVMIWASSSEMMILAYILIFLNIVVFGMTFVVLKDSIKHLTDELKEYGLNNIITKVGQSFYIIMAADALLIIFTFVILLTSVFPVPLLISIVSVLLNPTFNLAILIGSTVMKYFASRSFTRAGLLLNNTN